MATAAWKVQDAILTAIAKERERQDLKWGEQNHSPEKWMTILMEEVGEAAKEVQREDMELYHHEMIQAAAVIVVALECLMRGKWESLSA